MRHLFAVIGLGRFRYSVAETLVQKGCEVLAFDLEEAKIQSISDIAPLPSNATPQTNGL